MTTQQEYIAIVNNSMWVLVPPLTHGKGVGNIWIFLVKLKPDRTLKKYKNRVIAKGYTQIEGIDYMQNFSLVVKSTTIKIVITLALTYEWHIQQVDVNNAFLNGELEEEVYMTQLEGFVDPTYPHCVCKLKK